MPNTLAILILSSCALAASAEQPGPLEPPVMNETGAAVETPEMVIADWPQRVRAEARALIEKYGEPSSFDENSLVWYDNGPWEKTALYRKAPEGFLGLHGKDILEQAVSYSLPDEGLAALKRFDPRLEFDKTLGRLSARSGSEKLNFLALNLADEIVAGRRGVDDARAFYRRTQKLADAGKDSPYTSGFLFRLRNVPPIK